MDKPLNKREREFLKPAIVHGWEIEISPFRKTALWDGDSLLPVIGTMAESLIKRGYLERVSMGFGRDIIRATARLKIYGVTVDSYGRTPKTVSKLAHVRIVTAALSQKEPTNDQ
jgi:hypothetical protein